MPIKLSRPPYRDRSESSKPNPLRRGADMLTTPGISIAADDRWIYHDQPIVNQDILSYFKRSLRRIGPDYYIENRWGERVEHAYLSRVQGFPLIARSLKFNTQNHTIELSLDSEESVEVLPDLLHYCDEQTIAALHPHTSIPIRLCARAMIELAEYLKDHHGNYTLEWPDGLVNLITTRSKSALLGEPGQ